MKGSCLLTAAELGETIAARSLGDDAAPVLRVAAPLGLLRSTYLEYYSLRVHASFDPKVPI